MTEFIEVIQFGSGDPACINVAAITSFWPSVGKQEKTDVPVTVIEFYGDCHQRVKRLMVTDAYERVKQTIHDLTT